MLNLIRLSVALVLIVLMVGGIGCGREEGTHVLVMDSYGLTWAPSDAKGVY